MTPEEKRNIEYEGSMELIEEFCDSKEYAPTSVSPYQKWLEKQLILAREELEKALSMNKAVSDENITLKQELDKVRQQSAEWERKYLWIRDKREKGIL